MLLDPAISDLISRIYGAVQSSHHWSAVLDHVMRFSHGRALLLSVVDLRHIHRSSFHFQGADDGRFLDAIDDYRAEKYRDDPMLRFAQEYPAAGIVDMPGAIARVDGDHDDYFRWYRSEMGSACGVVSYSLPVDDMTIGISIHPDVSQGRMSPDRLAMFRMLAGHVEQALRIAARPPLLDEDEATIIVDRHARIAAMSDRAAAIVARGDGLLAKDGLLLPALRSEAAPLNSAIRSALGATARGGLGGWIGVRRAAGGRPYMLAVTPLPRPAETLGKLCDALSPGAAIRIIDPDAGPEPRAVAEWSRLYRFTPAESRLAAALLSGCNNLRDAANSLGLSYATARVHLRNLFEKAEVGSQAQLVRLLTRVE